MKKLIQASLIIAGFFIIVSCNHKKHNEEDYHVHEDGSVHKDHSPEAETTEQETFTVNPDSSITVQQPTENKSENKSEHSHNGKKHTH